MTEIDPYAGTNALGRGFAMAQNADQSGARRRAGSAMAAGDRAGARNALGGAGMLDEVAAMDDRQAQTEERQRARQTAAQEQARQYLLRGTTALRQAPEARRGEIYQMLRPTLVEMYRDQPGLIEQIDRAPLTNDSLDSLMAALGQEQQAAPSGYRWGEGGNLNYIPGGPQDPANKGPVITPYGIMLPPGAPMPQVAGAPAPQPEVLGSDLPPGWNIARPNQAPSAPAAGGAERNQPVSVNFRSSSEAQRTIQGIVPGVRVTSGRRSADQNRRVGGAPTSYHLQDRARDLVPPSGMSMAQLAQKMRQAGFRALNEGDHVHVSW